MIQNTMNDWLKTDSMKEDFINMEDYETLAVQSNGDGVLVYWKP